MRGVTAPVKRRMLNLMKAARRLFQRGVLSALCLLGALGIFDVAGQTSRTAGKVLLVEIEGPIGPATTRALEEAREDAAGENFEALVLRLNTPGGLVVSTREIVNAIAESPVPVIGYVAPAGAHAASAGTFILYATHIAAMAPGTNLGAATPVEMGGQGPSPAPSPEKTQDDSGNKSEEAPDSQASPPSTPEALRNKQINDAVSFIRALAELRGRNAEWAEKAVREAATLTAGEALETNVVEIVADSLEGVLAAADGREVSTPLGDRTLATQGAEVVRFEPGAMTKLLGAIANPNIAFILMMIGIYGLIFEFANPGSIGPGIIGAVSLILGLYALNQLPLDYAGLALLLLGIALMVAEAFTPTFGVLGLGGLASFVMGAVMLIDTEAPGFQISWTVITATAIVTGALLVFLLGYVYRAHRRPVQAGAEHLKGAQAEVIDWSGATGHVWLEGERWSARTDGSPPAPGDRVAVAGMDGLTVIVRPLGSSGNQPQSGSISHAG